MTLQGELKVDPLIMKAVQDKLSASEGANLQPGLLPNIQYSINGVASEGLKHFDATINGSVVTITLDIDPDAVAQVMFRFATTGLPYYLNWTVPGDPVQKGQLDDPLFLHLSRRTGGRIEINGMQVSNEESTGTAKITYVRTSTGRIIPIKKVAIKAGETITLTDITLQQGEHLIDVPDMGIVYDDKGFENAISHFLVLPGGSVIDNITVTNNIPATFSPVGSGLTYQVRNVEVDIALVDPNTQTVEPPFAHQLLSPDSTQGSVLRAQLTRLSGLSNRYHLTGKVNFTDGGSVNLKTFDITSPDIHITIDNLTFQ